MTLPVRLPVIPRIRRLPVNRARLAAVLDVGSSKMSCLIAKLSPFHQGGSVPGRTHAIEVIGIGHQAARGVKSGAVVSIDAAERRMRSVIDVAERMAGVTVGQVIVNISCNRIQSEIFRAHASVKRGRVAESDICNVLFAGRAAALSEHHVILHAVPLEFALDQERGIYDPHGMAGGHLFADVHVVSAESMPALNLTLCVNRCHLNVEGFVATPYASGLSCLLPDEMKLGVTLVDMGAETTSVSIFHGGRVVYCDAVPLGGAHITADIARGLSTSLVESERLKTLYGGALATESDGSQLIFVPPISDDLGGGLNHVPRLALIGIIRARLEEIFELVKERVISSGFADRAGGSLVLTGGACQMPGLIDLARRILSKQARIGHPSYVRGLPEFACSPSFSTVCGLLVYPQIAGLEVSDAPVLRKWASSESYLVRMGQWIKESF